MGEAEGERFSPQVPADLRSLPPRIIFYDGLCSFCDGWVSWLLAHDDRRRFHYAALQGSTAKALSEAWPEAFPAEPSSLVYVDTSATEPAFYLRSRAVFEILAELGGWYRMVSWLRVLPRPVTDLPYRLAARIRYRLYGRSEACRVPDPEVKARFLN